MSDAVKNVIGRLTKDVERDLIDHSTGLIEDIGKTLRLVLYKNRGIEAKDDSKAAPTKTRSPPRSRSHHTANTTTGFTNRATDPESKAEPTQKAV